MNIQDIAREAGVSIATVSRVINRHDVVQHDTRRRVEEIIRKHGYTPNALARGLLKKRTRTVGVLTVDILNPYYGTVVHSIERSLNTLGYNSFLCNTGDDPEEKRRYVQALLEKRSEALVFVGSIYTDENGEEIMRSAASQVPVVLVNSAMEAPNVFSVLCDDRQGVCQAAEYLLSIGKRHLLFINTLETRSARIKEDAFRSALSRNTAATFDIVETSDHTLAELNRSLPEILAETPYDAILATDDLFANVSLNVLHSLGRRIPEDVAVVGYNNSYVSQYAFPQLTSVDSRMEVLGERAAEILDSVLSASPPEHQIEYLEPRLVVKGSTED
jgi:DNA-binding LacI/PurR family transcriptional regulator